MNFEILLETISPTLKKIAGSYNGRSRFIDKEDIYQEMCVYLWTNFRAGRPAGLNRTYIVKGCEFHILNYLRKEREKGIILNLEQPFDEKGNTLRDILPDREESLEAVVERRIIIDEIKNNDFSNREKEVLAYLLEGFTVREIGEKLEISHVMVVKYKKRIIGKCQKKIGRLPKRTKDYFKEV